MAPELEYVDHEIDVGLGIVIFLSSTSLELNSKTIGV